MVASTLDALMNVNRMVLILLSTLSERKAWYATNVRKRKYIGFGEVIGFIRLKIVTIHRKLSAAKQKTYHVVLFKSVPDIKEESGEVFFGNRYTVYTDPLTNCDKMR